MRLTFAKGSEMVKLFNFNLATLPIFSINTAHTDEHYRNMVTYMRLKGIVPPTSEKPAGFQYEHARGDCGLADLCSNRFAGHDDLHSAVFLSPLVTAVVCNGLDLAQSNGCYRICRQPLLHKKLAHRVPALLR